MLLSISSSILSSVSFSNLQHFLFNSYPLDEKNPNLKTVYVDKMKQYLDRAEYIKKTALKGPEHSVAPKEEDTPPPEGGATTAKKNTKQK